MHHAIIEVHSPPNSSFNTCERLRRRPSRCLAQDFFHWTTAIIQSTVTSIVLPYSFPVLVRRSARHARVTPEAKLEAVKRVFCSLFYDRSLLRVYLTVQMNALVPLPLLSRGPFSPLAVPLLQLPQPVPIYSNPRFPLQYFPLTCVRIAH